MKSRRFFHPVAAFTLLVAALLLLGACQGLRGPQAPTTTVTSSTTSAPATASLTGTPRSASPSPSPSPTSTPAPPTLGEIMFSDVLQPSGAIGAPGLIFPPGIERVYVSVAYQNIRPETRFEERWYRNDELWITRASAWRERSPSSAGTLVFASLSVSQGLPPGQYRLELWVNEALTKAGYFIILQAPTPTFTPTITLTWTPTPTDTFTPTPTETSTLTPTPTLTPTLDKAAILRLAYRAAAYLQVPKDSGGAPSEGTGIMVDTRGLILTNFHLVGDPWTRQLYNQTGRVEVGISPDPVNEPVRLLYVAEVILTDPDLDLAVLNVKTDIQGRTLPRGSFFPAVALGDDRTLAFQPDVNTCGYPADSLRAVVLHGIYTGHSSDGRWFEVAAPFFEGYSGGMALSDDALLVGIINSFRQSQQDPRTSRYFLRPVNLAKPIIAQGIYFLDFGILPATPTPAPPADAPLGLVIAPSGLNIRSGPGINNPSVYNAPRGTLLLLSSRRQSDSTGQLWREVWVKGRQVRGWAVEIDIQVLDPNVLQPPAPLDMIAFASNRFGNNEIMVMRSDGSQQRNLTNHGANDGAPSWSPDRTRLAFVSDREGVADIYTMRYDGTDVRRLTYTPAQELHPAWSPDGTRIAYVSNVDGDYEIWIMDADGTNHRQWTQNDAWDSYPSWSPDNRFVAFTSQRDGNYEIYRVDLVTAQETRLTNNPATDAFPAWSPLGAEIAFISTRDGPMDIYILIAEHPEVFPQRVPISALGNEINRFPAWSPDARTLLFTTWRDGNAEIYSVSVEGTNLRNLTQTVGDDEEAVWIH